MLNPWVLTGICLLLLFFGSYLSALSWADLTYVLPATAFSYVLMALLAKFFLYEQVTISRWVGIALITAVRANLPARRANICTAEFSTRDNHLRTAEC